MFADVELNSACIAGIEILRSLGLEPNRSCISYLYLLTNALFSSLPGKPEAEARGGRTQFFEEAGGAGSADEEEDRGAGGRKEGSGQSCWCHVTSWQELGASCQLPVACCLLPVNHEKLRVATYQLPAGRSYLSASKCPRPNFCTSTIFIISR